MFNVQPGEVKYFEYAQIARGYKKYGNTEVADKKDVYGGAGGLWTAGNSKTPVARLLIV